MDQANPKTRQLPPAISMSELCTKDLPDQQWLVENIFAAGTINMVSASPNNFKTWVLLHVALCLARGRNVFAKFETKKCGVLIVNEDDTERSLKNRSLLLHGDPEQPPAYFNISKGIKINDGMTDRLIAEMKAKELKVIIFDTFSSVHTADENDASKMMTVFDQLKNFTHEGFTVILSHHHRKRLGDRRDDSQEQTRGSSVINAVLGCHLTCEERDIAGSKHILIHQAKLKEAEKLRPFLVKFEQSGAGIDLVYAGENGTLGKENRTAEKAATAILETLRKDGVWTSKKEFAELGVGTFSIVKEALAELRNARRIKEGFRGDLEKMSAHLRTSKGKHNEKLYLLNDDVTDVPAGVLGDALTGHTSTPAELPVTVASTQGSASDNNRRAG
jgi:hypothetical protein